MLAQRAPAWKQVESDTLADDRNLRRMPMVSKNRGPTLFTLTCRASDGVPDEPGRKAPDVYETPPSGVSIDSVTDRTPGSELNLR
jgi:hypothetical protein